MTAQQQGYRGSTPSLVLAVLGFVVLAIAAVALSTSAQVLDPLGPFPPGRSTVTLEPGSYLVYEVRTPPGAEEPGRDLAPVAVLGPDGAALASRDEEQISPTASRDWAERVLVGEVDVVAAGAHVVLNGTAVPVALSPSRQPAPALVGLAAGAVLLVGGVVGLVRGSRRAAGRRPPTT